jgi:hypothetical protein
MICLECSSFTIPKKGDIVLNDDILGEFTVKDVEYDMCETCGDSYYPPETLKKIEAQESRIKENLLLERSLKEFIYAEDVAEILDCTRQAVHKNKRIRRGFIHWLKYGGKICYLKKSVIMFKKTGDGRLPLASKQWGPVKNFGPLTISRGKSIQRSFESGGEYKQQTELSVSEK